MHEPPINRETIPVRLLDSYNTVFPAINGLRGTTRLRTALEDRATKSLVEPVNDGYRLQYDDVEILLENWQDFREVVASQDVIFGYTLFRDVKAGDTVIDAGACPGDFTVYAAKKAGDEGHVIALEPDAENANKLRQILERNEVDNVTVVEKCLYSHCETVGFTELNSISSEIRGDANKEVECVTLDACGSSSAALIL